jgi:hypothetical protein
VKSTGGALPLASVVNSTMSVSVVVQYEPVPWTTLTS